MIIAEIENSSYFKDFKISSRILFGKKRFGVFQKIKNEIKGESNHVKCRILSL